MRFRTWPVVAAALAGLLALIVVSVAVTRRKAQDIYTQLDDLNTRHRQIEATLRRLRSDVHLSGIFIRDYLLDHDQSSAPAYRQQLTALRISTTQAVGRLMPLMGGRETGRLSSLQAKLDDYWEAFEPLFDWTPEQKSEQSTRFLRREVLPRRDAVLAIASEIEEINNSNLADQRREVADREQELRSYLDRLLWRAIALGLLVAVAAAIRIRLLEGRSEQQRVRTERAEAELRRLSHDLVAAQEEERRRLSRELHDEIGQTLTALRIELGRVERTSGVAPATFAGALGECKRLLDLLVQTVRNLAMGLRPSMLDDLGLEPALAWHTRDFSTRFHVDVDLAVDGDLERLPDSHRTCIYRVVQEALTNCARHADATRLAVAVARKPDGLHVSVSDNGIGIDPGRRGEGLGLIGIEERLRELGGTLSIRSTPSGGTTLTMRLPVAEDEPEVPVAYSAR